MFLQQIDDTTYEAVLFDGDKVEIGDKNSADFKPHIKLNRWGGECFIKVDLPTTEKSSTSIQLDRIKWVEQDIEACFHPLENSFEFDIILKKKPKTNQIILNIESQGLEFYYQPPLTEEFKEGWSEEIQDFITVTETEVKNSKGEIVVHRPDNVVGSYAVYHATITNMHRSQTNADKYKCGKAFHIYYPYLTDANGQKVRAEDFNISKGLMTVTLPQDFLDNAKYPVTIDPEFGYHPAAPATSYALIKCIAMAGAAFIHTASTGDTITKFSVYGYSGDGTTGFDAAAYSIVGGVPSARLEEGVTIALPSSKAWTDSAAVSQSMSNGITYCVAYGNDGAGTEYAYYDTGSGDNRSEDNTAGALPATWTHSSWSTTRWGIYCTYTVGVTDYPISTSCGLTVSATVAKTVSWRKATSTNLSAAVTIVKSRGRTFITNTNLSLAVSVTKSWGRTIITSTNLSVATIVTWLHIKVRRILSALLRMRYYREVTVTVRAYRDVSLDIRAYRDIDLTLGG